MAKKEMRRLGRLRELLGWVGDEPWGMRYWPEENPRAYVVVEKGLGRYSFAGIEASPDDATFIAESKNALPLLLGVVEEAQRLADCGDDLMAEDLDDLRELLVSVDGNEEGE